MTTALPKSTDVIVVGGGNAAFCAALAAAEQGVSVLVLERAPEDEAGGNSRFTAGAFRCVYDGVEDLRALMPDLTDEEVAEVRLRHLHRRKILRRHGPHHRIPHRSRPVRNPDQAQQGDHVVDARQGRALHADLGTPGLQDRRHVQVLGRADGGSRGRRARPGRCADQDRAQEQCHDRLRRPRAVADRRRRGRQGRARQARRARPSR